jgi:hypothetical protein
VAQRHTYLALDDVAHRAAASDGTLAGTSALTVA